MGWRIILDPKQQIAGISSLGKRVTKFERLEVFPAPANCCDVTLTTDEVTANCPVTGQPDFYEITVDYRPNKLCVESKTVKLYFQQFRNKGLFCEALSAKVAQDFANALRVSVSATVKQKSRGGVSIVATSRANPIDAKSKR